MTEFLSIYIPLLGFPDGSDGKESACNGGDLGSIPGSGRSLGGGHGNPLEFSCPENSHGWRSLAGYNSWGCKELDMTERLSTHTYTYIPYPFENLIQIDFLPEKVHTQIMYKIFLYNSRVPGLLKAYLWTDWEFIDYRIRTLMDPICPKLQRNVSVVGRSIDSGARFSEFKFKFSLTSCVTLGKSLNFVPQFSHLYIMGIIVVSISQNCHED